ncbi:MAG: flavin reductase [Deltaproteobacteria bacterium]|nr:flavin reductase [Deltaproteobacteria bacterium]
MSEQPILDALARIPYPVAVVTVGRGGVENGLTVSWLSQVSFSPPQIMIAIDNHHFSIDFLRSTANFAVNLLREDQRDLAAHFAGPSDTGRGKLEGLQVDEAPSGAPVLRSALAFLDCELVASHPCGDHSLFIGEVLHGAVLADGAPLTTATGMRYHRARPKKASS